MTWTPEQAREHAAALALMAQHWPNTTVRHPGDTPLTVQYVEWLLEHDGLGEPPPPK